MKKLIPFVQNFLLVVLSCLLTLFILEWYIRHSHSFRYGGDREPRNDPQLQWAKPEGVKRVVVIGDSLTYGDGVRAVETYPYKLQEKLRIGVGENVQVVNLGIMGINIDQEAMLLTQKNPYFKFPALSLTPDLLVWTFCVNDIELMPDPKPRPQRNVLPPLLHRYFWKHSRLYYILHIKLNQLLALSGMQPSYAEYLQCIYRENTQEWKQFNQYLYFVIETVKRQNIPFLLVIFPSLEQLGDSHPYADLYEFLMRVGEVTDIEALNLFPNFQGKRPGTLKVSFRNGHPNALAHEIAAEAISQRIIERNMLR